MFRERLDRINSGVLFTGYELKLSSQRSMPALRAISFATLFYF